MFQQFAKSDTLLAIGPHLIQTDRAMRKATSALVFLVLLSGTFAIKSPQEVGADESQTDSSAAAAVYTTVYRVHDLPVYTAEKMFMPSVLMELIQRTV